MKNSFVLNTIIFFAMAALCSSCQHYYYQPSANNVPLFREKNEARIQLQTSSGNYLSGFDAQTAYAVGKHTGLQLNFFHTGDKAEGFGSGKGDYIEAAAGYFKPLPNNRWIFETYAGIGEGWVTNVYETSASSKFGMTKLFMQPSFGFTSKHFDIALSSKISLADYNLLSSSVNKDDYASDAAYIDFLNNKSFFLWEPGLMMRGGFEHLKFLLQVTRTIAIDPGLRSDNVNASFGIIVPFKIKSK
jgi:hypothetical protein